jgi:hypothetical protein
MSAMNSIGFEFVETLLRLFRQYPKPRAITIGILLVFIVFLTVIYLYIYFNRPELLNGDLAVAIAVGGVFSASLLATALLSFATPSLHISRVDQELAPILKERHELRERVSEKNEPDLFDAVQLNLNQLSEYYTINKSQARSTFRASISAIVVGLLTMVAGVWIFYFRDVPNTNLTYLTVVCGVLLEFIGGAYFYLHNRSLSQLNFFFSRLVTIQDTMLSIKLSELIEPQERRSHILERLIFVIISRDVKLPAEPTVPPKQQRTRIRANVRPDDRKQSNGEGVGGEGVGSH